MEAIRDRSIGAYPGSIQNNSIDGLRERTRAKSRSKSKVNIYELQKGFVIFGLILSLLLIIYMVLGYTQMVSINSKNKVTQIENENIELAINALEVKLQPYTSKERIEKIASYRLEMVYPQATNIVRLETLPTNEVQVAEKEETKDISLTSFIGAMVR